MMQSTVVLLTRTTQHLQALKKNVRKIITSSSLRAAPNASATKHLVAHHRFQHTSTNDDISKASRPSTSSTMKNNHKKHHSTMTAGEATVMNSSAIATTDPPASLQLRRIFLSSAIPMIGFGFMDQTVMLQAGNMIDCTIGVTFGLSTLTAAAIGQICSDGSGIMFGSTLERLSVRAGLPAPVLSEAQRVLPMVKRTQFAGAFLGVILGCCLGLVNLLLIDTNRSSTLKLQAFQEEQEFEFLIEASNAKRSDATALTVRGPDVDGLLASMTAALAVKGCSLVELHAKRNIDDDASITTVATQQQDTRAASSKSASSSSIYDVFYIVQRDTGQPFPDEELPELAQLLLDATRTPMNITSVTAAMHELEQDNAMLRNRVHKLEAIVQDQMITIVPTGGR